MGGGGDLTPVTSPGANLYNSYLKMTFIKNDFKNFSAALRTLYYENVFKITFILSLT